jgi:hypothetical protein
MPEEGNTVVTIRKVTARVDAAPAPGFYHGTIGELFWAILRRGCGGGPRRLEELRPVRALGGSEQ